MSTRRPATTDHHKPDAPPSKWADRRVAFIRDETDPETGAGLISCKCGWSKFHRRAKVRQDAADAHARKRHKGRAVRL